MLFINFIVWSSILFKSRHELPSKFRSKQRNIEEEDEYIPFFFSSSSFLIFLLHHSLVPCSLNSHSFLFFSWVWAIWTLLAMFRFTCFYVANPLFYWVLGVVNCELSRDFLKGIYSFYDALLINGTFHCDNTTLQFPVAATFLRKRSRGGWVGSWKVYKKAVFTNIKLVLLRVRQVLSMTC